MEQRISNLKTGIKEDVKRYMEDYRSPSGELSWHWRDRGDRIQDILEIIDKQFNKLED